MVVPDKLDLLHQCAEHKEKFDTTWTCMSKLILIHMINTQKSILYNNYRRGHGLEIDDTITLYINKKLVADIEQWVPINTLSSYVNNMAPIFKKQCDLIRTTYHDKLYQHTVGQLLKLFAVYIRKQGKTCTVDPVHVIQSIKYKDAEKQWWGNLTKQELRFNDSLTPEHILQCIHPESLDIQCDTKSISFEKLVMTNTEIQEGEWFQKLKKQYCNNLNHMIQLFKQKQLEYAENMRILTGEYTVKTQDLQRLCHNLRIIISNKNKNHVNIVDSYIQFQKCKLYLEELVKDKYTWITTV